MAKTADERPGITTSAEQAERDRLFSERRQRIDDFDFGAKTAGVFDDMLDRSVPFYQEIQRMVAELAVDFAEDGTSIYDLGCSTGTTLQMLASRDPAGDVDFWGVDNSAAMLRRGPRDRGSAPPRPRLRALAPRRSEAGRRAYERGPWRAHNRPSPSRRPSAARR